MLFFVEWIINLENLIDFITLLLTALSSALSVITIIILIKELGNQKKAIHGDSYKAIIDILQNEKTRKARNHVLNKLGKKTYSKWNPTDTKQAEEVCHTYDTVGQLVNNNFIPLEYVIDNWGHSILRCWINTQKLVNDYRKKNFSPKLWDDFESLTTNDYIKTKPYFKIIISQ